jgi:hypothetical protein
MRRIGGAALAGALAVGALVAPGAALARGGGDDPPGDDRGGDRARPADVRRTGTCTGASAIKLKLGGEDAGLEAELEVDQNRAGVPWRVTLSRGSRVVLTRVARTRAPSGSFEVRHVLRGAGSGARVSGLARNPASGEVCRVAAVA